MHAVPSKHSSLSWQASPGPFCAVHRCIVPPTSQKAPATQSLLDEHEAPTATVPASDLPDVTARPGSATSRVPPQPVRSPFTARHVLRRSRRIASALRHRPQKIPSRRTAAAADPRLLGDPAGRRQGRRGSRRGTSMRRRRVVQDDPLVDVGEELARVEHRADAFAGGVVRIDAALHVLGARDGHRARREICERDRAGIVGAARATHGRQGERRRRADLPRRWMRAGSSCEGRRRGAQNFDVTAMNVDHVVRLAQAPSRAARTTTADRRRGRDRRRGGPRDPPCG